MVRFSPGVAQGCFELLTLCKKHPSPVPYFLSSFSRFGSITSENIFSTAQTLRWVCVDEHGVLAPTVEGERLLSTNGYAHLLRQMLLDYIDVERPSWIQNAISGRAKVLGFAGSEIGQVFVEASLADGTDEDTVVFWDTMAARARGIKNERQNEIGRQGERLTLDYEKKRTGRTARWISIESNEDGYDILSVVASDDLRKLSIEVKASTMGVSGSFYLTANEWERAQETMNHAFHLWDISKAPARLCVADINAMSSHVPQNQGHGNWQSVRVPFLAFQAHFFHTRSSNY